MGVFEWHGERVKRIVSEVLRSEEERCAIRLRNRVEAYVPVDTGQLRATIKKYKSKLGPEFGYTVFAGNMPPGGSLQAMPKRMKYWRRYAFYALWAERGTAPRYTSKGRYTGRMKAKRFMRKAINVEKQFFYTRLREAIK